MKIMKIEKKRATINFKKKTLDKIDKERNGIPRSVYVDTAMEGYLKTREGG